MKYLCLIIVLFLVGFTAPTPILHFKSVELTINESGKPDVSKKVNAQITIDFDKSRIDINDSRIIHFKIIDRLSQRIVDKGEDTEAMLATFELKDEKGKAAKAELAFFAHTTKGMDGMLLIHTSAESQLAYTLQLQPPRNK